jgi:adenylate cyclase
MHARSEFIATSKTRAIDDLAQWLVGGARPFGNARDIFDALCARLNSAGVPVDRAAVFMYTLHPHVLGRRMLWKPGEAVQVDDAEHRLRDDLTFQNSPAVVVPKTGEILRVHLETAVPPYRFPTYGELKDDGMTDYLIYPLVYTSGETHAASFTTRRAGGFDESDIDALMRIQAPLARLTESYVLQLNASQLLSAYVGRNAGRRVLDGQVKRGDTEETRAAILFCDLKDSTAWSDSRRPSEVIERLNSFFDFIVKPVEEQGGEVLKFIGDGLLAIFPVGATGEGPALEAAARAVTAARTAINESAGNDLAFRAALHAGNVSYGNIGGGNRLDFTAIGPAVNLASRLMSVASETGNDLVCSSLAAHHLKAARPIGRFTLKGIASVQTVFSLPERHRPMI